MLKFYRTYLDYCGKLLAVGSIGLAVLTLRQPAEVFAEDNWTQRFRLTQGPRVEVMKRLQDIRLNTARVAHTETATVVAQNSGTTPEEQSAEAAAGGESPTGKSTSVEGRFPGADVRVEPKDKISRVGGMPLDVPEGLDLGKDARERAILRRQKLLNRFNPALGFVIEPIVGYTKRNQQFKSGTGADAGRDVGTRFPSNVSTALRTIELFAAAEVDPFARAYVIAAGHSEGVDDRGSEEYGKAQFEVEEAAIQTTSLPWNLSVRGGRFFADWGYLGRRHAHDLPQIDVPPSLYQSFGANRTDGVELAWLVPTPFYLQMLVGYGSSFGQLGEGPLTPHVQQVTNGNTVFGSVRTYYDIDDDNNLEFGFSTMYSPQGRVPEEEDALLPEDDKETARYVLNGDFHYRWYPLGRGLRQSLSLHGEFYYDWGQNRRNTIGRSVSRGSWGGYTYAEYRISKRWRPGFRFDYYQLLSEPALVTNSFTGLEGSTAGASGSDTDVWTYSPYVTFYPSEFQRFVLQYNHQDHGKASDQDQVILQWQVVIGSHQHGFTERD